jgi:hypothetical protein
VESSKRGLQDRYADEQHSDNPVSPAQWQNVNRYQLSRSGSGLSWSVHRFSTLTFSGQVRKKAPDFSQRFDAKGGSAAQRRFDKVAFRVPEASHRAQAGMSIHLRRGMIRRPNP